MKVVPNAPLTPSPLPGIQHATLAGSAQGLRNLSLWRQVIAPGGGTPPHRHDCEEVVLCTAGRGALLFDEHGVERRLAFGAGDTVCIARNQAHQLINDGEEPLHLDAVFSCSPVEAFFPQGERIDLPWPT